jgi:hypothetical protein
MRLGAPISDRAPLARLRDRIVDLSLYLNSAANNFYHQGHQGEES